jgi:alpha-glucoside transport system permease protein
MLTIVLWAIVAVIGVPLILSGYIFGVERLLERTALGRVRGLRPVMWLLPAILPLLVFLIYPVIHTAVLSLKNANSTEYLGFKNYTNIFTDESMLLVLRNNLLWLVAFTAVTVILGLVIAVLADRVKYESTVKAAIFLPMAISFVAAGVIWKFMYWYQPADMPQLGTINAFFTTLFSNFEPRAWLQETSDNAWLPSTPNWALIAVGVWMWVGFAMVILSASLKGIPESLLEAARMEGANELQIFFKVTLPLMMPTIAVVTTTLVVTVLKIFDVVYVMTNGEYQTDVIANRMYKEMFNYRNFGQASAFAVVLLLSVIPVIVINIRRFGKESRT